MTNTLWLVLIGAFYGVIVCYGRWEQLQYIVGDGYTAFGDNVRISENHLIVTGTMNLLKTIDIYEKNRTNNLWVKQQHISMNDSSSGHGKGIGIFNDTIIIGEANTGNIIIYTYTKSANKWQETQYIILSDTITFNMAGIAVNNKFMVVGCYGKVHVFMKNETNYWIKTQLITQTYTNTTTNNEFGYDIAIYNNILLISNPAFRKVYIYTFNDNNTTWILSNEINSQNPQENIYFGENIGLNSKYMIIKESRYLTIVYNWAYVYEINNTSKFIEIKLPSNCDVIGDMGMLTINNDNIVIACPYGNSYKGIINIYNIGDDINEYAINQQITAEYIDTTLAGFGSILDIYDDNMVVSAFAANAVFIYQNIHTKNPTTMPTFSTVHPTSLPSTYPSLDPTLEPTIESIYPSLIPSLYYTQSPFITTKQPPLSSGNKLLYLLSLNFY